jgi:4-hydroxy-tetrahydrodipicolinate synthase
MDTAGIHVIAALGNTAEVYQLTTSERRLVLATVAAATESARRIAGLCGAREDILRDGDFAVELGYDGVMIHEPVDPLGSKDGAERFYLDLADRLPLPVVLYIRSPRLSTDQLVRVADHPNIAGVKYARHDVPEFVRLISATRSSDTVWVCGAAESVVTTFAPLGIAGFTSGLANVRPDLSLDIWRAASSADWNGLVERVSTILPFELMRTRDAGRFNVSVLKRALAWQGWDVGDVRSPCVDLDAETERELRDLLASWPEATVVTA